MEKPAQWALVGAAWFLALSIAILGFLVWQHLERSSTGPVVGTAAVGDTAELAVGASTVCPVTGEKLVVAADTPRLVYQDRVYYFSAKADAAGTLPKRRFLMDPESFVHPGVAPALVAPTPLPTVPSVAAPVATRPISGATP